MVWLGTLQIFRIPPGASTFRESVPKSEVNSLFVHLLDKESKVIYWRASHRLLLPQGENNLWLYMPQIHYISHSTVSVYFSTPSSSSDSSTFPTLDIFPLLRFRSCLPTCSNKKAVAATCARVPQNPAQTLFVHSLV